MKIQEIDDLIGWVKHNVWDMPKTGDGIPFEVYSPEYDTAPSSAAEQTPSEPEWADRTAPAEYDFPLSLLEHILGLDRD